MDTRVRCAGHARRRGLIEVVHGRSLPRVRDAPEANGARAQAAQVERGEHLAVRLHGRLEAELEVALGPLCSIHVREAVSHS